MIYGLFFRRYAPFESFGGGFEGDNRKGASTSLTATARTIGALTFAPGSVGNLSASSSGTEVVGLGAYVRRILGRHFSDVTSSVSVSTRTIDCLRFTAQTAGANPLPIVRLVAPDIDTFLDVQIVFRGQTIEISGTVRGDNFPNAEVFTTDAKGQSVLLFEFATSGGRTTGPITRLAGSHRSTILGSFSKRIPLLPSGAFTYSSPQSEA